MACYSQSNYYHTTNFSKNIPRLRKRLDKIEKIAGIDVSFNNGKSCAAVCVFPYPQLVLIGQKTIIMKFPFPYVPTLLTFREDPVIRACFEKIKNKPDVILFDGRGIGYPWKIGLATHIGLWLKLSAIGYTNKPLCGEFNMPPPKGSYSFITKHNLPIVAALRTRDNTKPVFVSPGYNITLEDAIKITLNSCAKYRIFQPLRAAHTLSKNTIKESLYKEIEEAEPQHSTLNPVREQSSLTG